MLIQSLLQNKVVKTPTADLNKIRVHSGLLTYGNKQFTNGELVDLFVHSKNTIKGYALDTVSNCSFKESSIKADSATIAQYLIDRSFTEINYRPNKNQPHSKTVTFEDEYLLIEAFYYAQVIFAHTHIKSSGIHTYRIFPNR